MRADERAQAIVWLGALFSGLSGMIEVRALAEGQSPHRCWCTSRDEAIAAIEREAAAGRNVYAGVATRRASGRGGKADLRCLCAVWADADYADSAAEERYRQRLRLLSRPPSLRVATGGGEHDYWFLDPTVDVSTPDGVECVEAILRGVTDAIGADRAATDASRILRVPGTVNYPDARKRARGRVPAPCRIVERAGHLYSLDDFAWLAESGRRRRPRTTAEGRHAVSAWDGALSAAVSIAKQSDPTVRLLLTKRHGELGYPSASEPDFALACRLIEAGHTDADIEAALRWRHAHTEPRPKDLQYFPRTVAAARARASSRRATS